MYRQHGASKVARAKTGESAKRTKTRCWLSDQLYCYSRPLRPSTSICSLLPKHMPPKLLTPTESLFTRPPKGFRSDLETAGDGPPSCRRTPGQRSLWPRRSRSTGHLRAFGRLTSFWNFISWEQKCEDCSSVPITPTRRACTLWDDCGARESSPFFIQENPYP